MFPFGGFLRGRDTGLLLPSVSMTQAGGWSNNASLGVYAYSDGDFSRRRNAVYTPETNAWIHEDSKPVNGALYEMREVNVNLASIGDGTWLARGNENWFPISGTLPWLLTLSGAQFEAFKSSTVTGELEVREIADPGNIAFGTFSFTCTYEGEN